MTNLILCFLFQTIPFFNIDDDSMMDNKPKPELLLTAENATFLSVNQLLESVSTIFF